MATKIHAGKAHIDASGNLTLNLKMATGLPESDVRVEVLVDPIQTDIVTNTENGWPPGFFEKFYGCFKDDPIQEWPEGDFEKREELL